MTQPVPGRGRASSRRNARPSDVREHPRGRATSRSVSDRPAREPAAGGGPAKRPARAQSAPSTRSARSARPARSGPQAALDAALADALVLAAGDTKTPSFADLGLPPLLVEALRRGGVEQPFAIQARALPDALAGRDVLGRAATGSGKTLAFGLPMLTRLAPGRDSSVLRNSRSMPGAPRALVLVPSRELALQVTSNLTPLADALGLRVASVVGGTGYAPQIAALNRGVDLLVATPGRLVDLIERRVCRLDAVEITALDEADYMADLGFLPVVTRLLGMTAPGGQRLLFSATLDRGVAGLVETFLNRPAVHAVAPATATIESMIHRVFVVAGDHKIQVAAEVAARPARTLFFVRTKRGADRLAKQLSRVGVDAAALHGNLAQNARRRVMAAFTEGRTRVLVATDVAARGLHVDGVDLVVHYDPPTDHKDYLHRSGRTARAGSTGTVVSFVQTDQMRDLRKLHLDAEVEPMIESVGPGHRSVLEMGASGDPVTVSAAAPDTVAGGRSASGRRRAPRRSGRGGGRVGA